MQYRAYNLLCERFVNVGERKGNGGEEKRRKEGGGGDGEGWRGEGEEEWVGERSWRWVAVRKEVEERKEKVDEKERNEMMGEGKMTERDRKGGKEWKRKEKRRRK